MDDSAVFAVRAKYAEDLEELVQCPVCFERPRGPVSMCIQGHHLCKRCRDMLQECPVCKSCFGQKSRNFVVEELCTKLDEIITTLMVSQNGIDISIVPPTPRQVKVVSVEKKTISTQTDAEKSLADESVIILDDNHMSSCKIGFCQAQLPADCMYHHVCDYHKLNLVEVRAMLPSDTNSDNNSIDDEVFHEFKMNYEREKLYDYAVHSKELGLFFLNVHVDQEGHLYFALQTTNASQENKFSYLLEISIDNGRFRTTYDGVIPTNLSGKKYLRVRKCEKDFFKCFYKSDMISLVESAKRSFTFSLYIMRNY